jgi:hypothetical protein
MQVDIQSQLSYSKPFLCLYVLHGGGSIDIGCDPNMVGWKTFDTCA